MLHYVLTLQGTRITGVHENALPFPEDFFENSAVYAQDEIRAIPDRADYVRGEDIRAYTADGQLRPLVDRILEGLADVPPGYELIDGELVLTEVPEQDAPPKLLDRILSEEKAARVMFRALAQSDVITEADALDNQGMFPQWVEHIGKRAEAGSYWQHNSLLYRVNVGQGHTIQETWPPDQAASLFSRVGDPGEEYPQWIQPTHAGNAYPVGAKVTDEGRRWINELADNTYKPGIYGWREDII